MWVQKTNKTPNMQRRLFGFVVYVLAGVIKNVGWRIF